MKSILIVLTIFMFLKTGVFSDEDLSGKGIFYWGEKFAFSVTPDEDLLPNIEILASQGIQAAFTLKGRTIRKDTPLLYIKPADIVEGADLTVEEYAKDIMESYSQDGEYFIKQIDFEIDGQREPFAYTLNSLDGLYEMFVFRRYYDTMYMFSFTCYKKYGDFDYKNLMTKLIHAFIPMVRD